MAAVLTGGRRTAPIGARLRRPNPGLVLLAALFVAMATLGTGGAFALRAVAKPPGATHRDAASRLPTYIPLPSMSLTLSDGYRLRTLHLRVLLEFDPRTPKDVVKPYEPRIVNALSSGMSDVHPSELTGADGSRIVKDVVTVAANRELRPLRVRGVLLQEMLVR